jgi:hypothetical protein
MYSTRKISAGLAVLGILTMGCDQVSENPTESATGYGHRPCNAG